ncbi:Mo-dependent nitrogenase C-terminal domain-containing protein [Dolichospermum sp. ST_con]|nr:Mo-dependent nitrogenase C-terminal domain-containing protein [Dolichospermum sp. ST_con]MDD1421246.1 Mo-dependent nitrogenase C-terminal domain-containing protein [Dolichospermum sp. ST_sed1]MDD1424342.1 Mo-dependent nitrogenase C-terminal domain-containing protein [Dolichospermum sp. ST_sed9]MDD1430802.1 Mo-dependent nitrogenase C-terminal domain-containing protein [Dolichospermum sp. ST_sed6]MDD1436917.1 Mo-dependent nitrogenase C-terminal domain-containing protein [Dolichospermum sp. ST_
MLKTNTQPIILSSFVNPIEDNLAVKTKFDLLQKLRQWCDEIEINDPQFARLIAKVIPAQCPFERDIIIFGRTIAHIPPMCKINPLYEQFVGLRFRALCYLVDKCGEDIQSYC